MSDDTCVEERNSLTLEEFPSLTQNKKKLGGNELRHDRTPSVSI